MADVYYKIVTEGNDHVYISNDPDLIGENASKGTEHWAICNRRRLHILGDTFVLPEDSRNLFYGVTDIYEPTDIHWNEIDASECKDMTSLFQDCYLDMPDFSSGDTSNVTSMFRMFYSANNLYTINMNYLDVSKVTNTREMFAECSALTEIYMRGLVWESNLNMRSMFLNDSRLQKIETYNNTDGKAYAPSNVNSEYMFSGCSMLPTGDGTYTIDAANTNRYFLGAKDGSPSYKVYIKM